MDLVFSRTRKIPNRSWGQECILCSSRHGVPIECSAVGCKAAYHTTCAIRGKLKMQAIFGKDFKGGIKLRSYCKEHSPSADDDDDIDTKSQADKIDASGVKEIDMTNLVDDRLLESNEELDFFWKYVDINQVHKNMTEAYKRAHKLKTSADLSQHDQEGASPKRTLKKCPSQQEQLKKRIRCKDSSTETTQNATNSDNDNCPDIDPLSLDLIYRYWTLLRTVHNGQSLIKFSPSALKEREFEQRKSILKLRIELERVRNLSYMIGKREKLKASWLKTHQNIIKRTFSVINDLKPTSDPQPSTEPLMVESNHIQNSHAPILIGSKKPPQTVQHLQPTNGMFDESDQLINDLISCDQIYDTPGTPTTSGSSSNNHSNLSYQDRSTLERRRTLSLVRRINRQLKSYNVEPSMNPYAKSYLALKRSNSPIVPQTSSTTLRILKYR